MALFLSVKLILHPQGLGCKGSPEPLQTERIVALSRSITDVRPSLQQSVSFGLLIRSKFQLVMNQMVKNVNRKVVFILAFIQSVFSLQ